MASSKKLRDITRTQIANGKFAFVVLSKEGYPTKHIATQAEINRWHRETYAKKELAHG